MNEQDLISFFGMTESKAKETIKNVNLSKSLQKIVEEYRKLSKGNPPKKVANCLYTVAAKVKPATERFVPMLVRYVYEEKLDSESRVTAALTYLLEHIKEDRINIKEFEDACGVGVVITHEEVENAVTEAIKVYKEDLLEKRYRMNTGILMTHVKNSPRMKWADGSKLKGEIDQQIRVLLGPKTEEELRPVSKKQSTPKDKKSDSKKPNIGSEVSNSDKDDTTANELAGLSSSERITAILRKLPFHKPGFNYTTEGYPSSPLALSLLEEHIRLTNGQVRTRFPPEPNGILHIGHAKAINIDFGYAKAHNGVCFLRYDDTNPEKEEERFFKSILEMVEWLGYTPYKVTHSSDYFNELYDFAMVLIRQGLAYVCHQKPEHMKGWNTSQPSPWRDRPMVENVALFEAMRDGFFDEGEATLRMKITLEEGKVDPVAYRIKYVPHPRVGETWCIYPTYDFTHCLCDSLEHITHSMCTKEFQNRRSSYYWLCESVRTYIPVQWEYGRLNMCYTVVSKRKIAKLISEGIVKDWDDPRLYTLPALRRRGFPPEAINDFCVRMGITGATIMVEPAMIEACVRDSLNVSAPRTMVVISPLKVVIENFPSAKKGLITVPDFPAVESSKTHKINLDEVIYIEKDDFRDYADKTYKRFAKNQTVGLRHAGLVLKFKDQIIGSDGRLKELTVTCEEMGTATKPKGFIHWVSKPIDCEVRLYERLFKHRNPEDFNEVPNGFLSDCTKDSLVVARGLADQYLRGAKPFTQYQFERIGYFSVDPDTTSKKLVFNRTVTLREDNEKN